MASGPRPASWLCLLLLLAADAAFVLVHLVHKHSSLLPSALYSLGRDGGYAEMFQYLKTFGIVVLLAALWSRTRERAYVAWMLLFAYLLGDDALQIHERGGALIARALSYPDAALGLWAQDWGELTVSGAAGIVFLTLIWRSCLRGTSEARNASIDLALLLAMLAFFGVFLDVLHAVIELAYLKPALGLAEDGGEMLAMSLVCCYVLRLLERRANASPWLWQPILGWFAAKRPRPA